MSGAWLPFLRRLPRPLTRTEAVRATGRTAEARQG
jgi:hypothetical protein